MADVFHHFLFIVVIVAFVFGCRNFVAYAFHSMAQRCFMSYCAFEDAWRVGILLFAVLFGRYFFFRLVHISFC